MKLLKHIIIAAAVMVGLASCSITSNRAFAPTTTQLQMQLDDMEYLGETIITVQYRQYLGFITVTDLVNGTVYNKADSKSFKILGSQPLYKNLDKAADKLLMEFPDADYFVVTLQYQQKDQLFLGSDVTSWARVKAYAFKPLAY